MDRQLKRRKGGQAPYGYRWEKGALVLDPHEAPVRRYIYELFLQHKRKKAVARILNQEGYRTRRRSKFSGTTIGRLITDPIGKGLWRTGHAMSAGKKKRWEQRPEEDWAHISVPALISEEMWDQCQTLLGSENKKESPHLFRDRIVCHCGARMNVRTRSQKYLCPSCANVIPKKKVEDVFVSQLGPFNMENNQENMQAAMRYKKRLLTHLTSEAAQIQTLLQHAQEHEMPQAENKERRDELIEQLQQIRETIPHLENIMQRLRQELLTASDTDAALVSLADRWGSFSLAEKRAIVERLVKRIIVGETSVRVVFSEAPDDRKK